MKEREGYPYSYRNEGSQAAERAQDRSVLLNNDWGVIHFDHSRRLRKADGPHDRALKATDLKTSQTTYGALRSFYTV